MRYSIFHTGSILCCLALALSCSKEQPVEKGKGMVILAGAEQHEEEEGASRTVFRPMHVNWVSTDKLKVFGPYVEDETFSLVFGTSQSDVNSAEFRTSGDWQDSQVPQMAVHMNASKIADCEPYDNSGTIRYPLYLPDKQKIGNKNSYARDASISMGEVSLSGSSGEYVIPVMRNAFSVLSFTVLSPNIRKVTLAGKNGTETVAGWLGFQYNSGNPSHNGSYSGETATSIDVTVTGSAAGTGRDSLNFIPNSSYHIAVFAGSYPNGLTLTAENKEGTRIRRTIVVQDSETKRLTRNKRHIIRTPLDYGVRQDDSLILDIPFSSWPFEEACAASADQSKTGSSGEAYTYSYDGGTKECTFVLANPASDNANNYYYWDSSSGFLRFNSPGTSGPWILLPAIEGRQLRSVTVSSSNTSSKAFGLNTVPSTTGVFGTQTVKNSTATSWNGGLEYGKAYYLVLTSSVNFQMTRLTLVYQKF